MRHSAEMKESIDGVVPTLLSSTYFILLDDADNVFVCISPVKTGQVIAFDEFSVSMRSDIQVGHKIARDTITYETKVIKYGVPIGSMTRTVARGEHVHLHNMKSDYIPVHTRNCGW